MKTLHLCARVPFPPTDGGAIGVYDIISNLSAQGCDVTLLAVNTPKHFQPEQVLQDRCRLIPVFVNTNLSPVKAFLNLFKSIPYVFERFVSEAYTAKLIALLKEETFDVIQVEGSQMASYVPVVRKHTEAPLVLRAHNVEYTIWQRLAQNEKNILKKLYLQNMSAKIKAFEKKYFNLFDAIAAITQEDEARIRELGCTTRIQIIPAGMEKKRFQKNPDIKPKPFTLLMIGALNWLPNQEGLEWLLTNIWPQVQKKYPNLELHIAGADPPEHLLKLDIPQVTMHGFVPSAADFMQQYELMLAPLLSGGGMRIKIIEGMGLGKCILTTSVGAEGIYYQNNVNIIVRDTVDEWIEVIGQYYSENIAVERMGAAASALATTVYDNAQISKKYQELYRSLKK